MWIVDAILSNKFLNPMIKRKGQRSNKQENICKHAETMWLNIFLLQMMISILRCTFRHGNKFVHKRLSN